MYGSTRREDTPHAVLGISEEAVDADQLSPLGDVITVVDEAATPVAINKEPFQDKPVKFVTRLIAEAAADHVIAS